MKAPPRFILLALPAIPMYALAFWLSLDYGSSGMSAFTTANCATAIYFACAAAWIAST